MGAKKVIGAGLVGTALGVAAGAATIILSDKKKRTQVVKTAKQLQKSAEDTLETLQKKAQEVVDVANDIKDEFLAEGDLSADKAGKEKNGPKKAD